MRHKTVFRVHCPVPGPSRSDPPGVLPGKVDKICGGHGQGETPGPIPNPEAKALHGDGTAPERVWESSAPPLSHDTVPPGRAPTGSRGDPLFSPTAPHPVIPAFISPHIHIHLYIFIHIHSFPPYPSIRPAGGAPGARTETEGHRPRRTRRVARRALHAPARAPARGAGSHRGRGAPAGRPAAPGRAAENGAIRVRRRGGRAGKTRKAPQAVHVPFLSWIAAGGTRCIHQVRE